jgi:hypothetical protein
MTTNTYPQVINTPPPVITPKKKMGRPFKHQNDATINAILTLVKSGSSIPQIAKTLGISTYTVQSLTGSTPEVLTSYQQSLEVAADAIIDRCFTIISEAKQKIDSLDGKGAMAIVGLAREELYHLRWLAGTKSARYRAAGTPGTPGPRAVALQINVGFEPSQLEAPVFNRRGKIKTTKSRLSIGGPGAELPGRGDAPNLRGGYKK